MEICGICGHRKELHGSATAETGIKSLDCIYGDSEGPCLCPGFRRYEWSVQGRPEVPKDG